MPTKKTSGKTAATSRAPHKKQDGKASQAPTTTTAAAPKAAPRPVKAAPSKPTDKAALPKLPAKTAKPEKATRKVAAPVQKNQTPPVKSAASARVAARIEAIPPQPANPSRDEIAARAAAIWRETGGAPFDNWIQAERELGA